MESSTLVDSDALLRADVARAPTLSRFAGKDATAADAMHSGSGVQGAEERVRNIGEHMCSTRSSFVDESCLRSQSEPDMTLKAACSDRSSCATCAQSGCRR